MKCLDKSPSSGIARTWGLLQATLFRRSTINCCSVCDRVTSDSDTFSHSPYTVFEVSVASPGSSTSPDNHSVTGQPTALQSVWIIDENAPFKRSGPSENISVCMCVCVRVQSSVEWSGMFTSCIVNRKRKPAQNDFSNQW